MNLAQVLKKWRTMLELEPADAARIIGIPTRTLTTLEKSGSIQPQAFAQVISWLAGSGPAKTCAPDSAENASQYQMELDKEPPSTMQRIAADIKAGTFVGVLPVEDADANG
jgi:hypothetical protein